MSPAVQQYGPYVLIRPIGKGNMGTVHLATRVETGQQVAVKIIAGGPSDDIQEKIALEEQGALAQKAAKDDPRVVTVNDILRVGGDLVIEMEYVAGKDLTSVMSGISSQQAAQIAKELCLMIESLAALGVLHCDLKPKNVLLAGDTGIKVIDFGIAKWITGAAAVDNPFQSIPYASPERLRTRLASVQSDLWAVAVILYQMIAGMHPFEQGDIRSRIMDGNGPSPFPPRNTCPQPLRQIVVKALDPKLVNRYVSPKDFAEDLDRFLAGKEVVAPDPLGTIRTEHPGEPTVRTERPGAPQPPAATPGQHVRRSGQIAALIIVGLLLGGPALLAYRWRSVRTEADLLRTELDSGKLSLGQVWTQYQQLRSSWVPTSGLRASIARKAQEVGARPIRDYEQEKPTSYEGEWQRAADAYNHLLEFDPGNAALKSRLLICEGHLKRIRAHYRKNGRPNLDQKTINGAIQDFNEAARLQTDSPDPYIGLARIYFYDQFDFDRGSEMINEAVRRGHPMGSRERLEIADGLKERAKRNLDKAREFAEMPDDSKQYLRRARDDYDAAIRAYQEIVDFMPSIPRIIKDITHARQQVDDQIDKASKST